MKLNPQVEQLNPEQLAQVIERFIKEIISESQDSPSEDLAKMAYCTIGLCLGSEIMHTDFGERLAEAIHKRIGNPGRNN